MIQLIFIRKQTTRLPKDRLPKVFIFYLLSFLFCKLKQFFTVANLICGCDFGGYPDCSVEVEWWNIAKVCSFKYQRWAVLHLVFAFHWLPKLHNPSASDLIHGIPLSDQLDSRARCRWVLHWAFQRLRRMTFDRIVRLMALLILEESQMLRSQGQYPIWLEVLNRAIIRFN